MHREKRENAFGRYHPAVNMLYFLLVMVYSVLYLHPVCLAISLVCAFIYSVRLNGGRALRFNLLCLLPMLVVCALMNPMFNHEGATILFYLPNDNPVTAESIWYGLASATMLVTAICWFSCYNAVMTTDKFIYLFGRAIPGLSLVLSMALRQIPRFKAQARIVASAQRGVGRDISTGNWLQRARQGARIFSMVVTWALENGVETADSMRSRGYGLRGRTAYALFPWTHRDTRALATILLCGVYVLVGQITGGLYYRYFPTFRWGQFDGYSVSVFVAFGVLCAVPLLVEALDAAAWKRSMQRNFPEPAGPEES